MGPWVNLSQPWHRHPAKWPHSFAQKCRKPDLISGPNILRSNSRTSTRFHAVTRTCSCFLAYTYHLLDLFFLQLVTNFKIEMARNDTNKELIHHLWEPPFRLVNLRRDKASLEQPTPSGDQAIKLKPPSPQRQVQHGLTDMSLFNPTCCLLILRLLVSATPLCIALGETPDFNHAGCIWVVEPHGLYKCHHHGFNIGVCMITNHHPAQLNSDFNEQKHNIQNIIQSQRSAEFQSATAFNVEEDIVRPSNWISSYPLSWLQYHSDDAQSTSLCYRLQWLHWVHCPILIERR